VYNHLHPLSATTLVIIMPALNARSTNILQFFTDIFWKAMKEKARKEKAVPGKKGNIQLVLPG
jgi:hypothetical protein